QLQILETGLDAQGQKVQTPVKEIVHNQGQTQLDANGRPVLGNAVLDDATKQPLPSNEDLKRQIEATTKQLQQEREAIKELIERNTQVTQAINGAAGKPGLRDLLAAEVRRDKEAREQQTHLE